MTKPEFIHGLRELKARYRPCVATIGSFDGVHRGHQVVLNQVKQKARALGLPSMVMLFEPQPYEFFSREQAPPRLMRLREKVTALFEQGIDRVVCIKFSQSFRSLSAEEYIQQVLVEAVGVKSLVIGDDFRFGCDRAGDFALLKDAGAKYGFDVSDTHTQTIDEQRISSTRIRKLLESNQLQDAKELLGKSYSVKGRVIYGQQLGRTLGFPTMNIGLGRYRSPVNGVFAVRVKSLTDSSAEPMDGVANVGVRPTVNGESKPLLEVHILNQDLNSYGQCYEVTFLSKLRDEKKFESLDELKQQIAFDIESANRLFTQ